MNPVPRPSPTLLVFLLAIAVCTVFALYTDHRWEDFYITYRSSKNLAEGHGLVFQMGERVHTFTSPLGVLLPALALKLTGTRSDEIALGIFRIWCSCALGGACVLLWRAATAWGWGTFPRALLALLPLLEPKCVDFSINGMETPFMLLFIAWAVAVLSTGGPRTVLRLGLAWGGLMWTRPDGFAFGGATAVAWFVFLPTTAAAADRRALLRLYLRAALVAGALYAPWFLWAWSYYGSPVPHTITAKGSGLVAPWRLNWLDILVRQTVLFAWQGRLRDAFLPAYSWFGGWPPVLAWWMRGAATISTLYWLLPRGSRVGRMASLSFLLSSLYATAVTRAPWYWPCHAITAMIVVAAAAEDLGRSAKKRSWPTGLARTPWLAHVALSVVLLGMTAWQLRQQQTIIEGQRRYIGYWLRANARSPQDTVYLEPLGYIGFFSQLKMYDFLGLASPEVVAARRRLGENEPGIIRELRPDWLVLRRFESQDIFQQSPALLDDYHLVASFDASPRLRQIAWLPGRPYLEYDEAFDVFLRKPSPGAPSRPVGG